MKKISKLINYLKLIKIWKLLLLTCNLYMNNVLKWKYFNFIIILIKIINKEEKNK